MKTKWSIQIAAAIIVIVSLSTVAVFRSSSYTDSEASFNLVPSATALSIILLVAVTIDMSALFYLISKAPTWHKTNTLASQRTLTPPAKVYTLAPIVERVKNHPLPPLLR